MDRIVENFRNLINVDHIDRTIDVHLIFDCLKGHLSGAERNQLAQLLLHNHDETNAKLEERPYLDLTTARNIGALNKDLYFYLSFPFAANSNDTPETVMKAYMNRWTKLVTCGCPNYLAEILKNIRNYIEKEIVSRDDVECFYIGVTSVKRPKGRQFVEFEDFKKGFFDRLYNTYGPHKYTHMVCLNALHHDRSRCRYPLTENLRLEESLFYHYSIPTNNPQGKFKFLPPKLKAIDVMVTDPDTDSTSASVSCQRSTPVKTAAGTSSTSKSKHDKSRKSAKTPKGDVSASASVSSQKQSKTSQKPATTSVVTSAGSKRKEAFWTPTGSKSLETLLISTCEYDTHRRWKSAPTLMGAADASKWAKYWQPGGAPDARSVDCYFFLYAAVKLTTDARDELMAQSGVTVGTIRIQQRPSDGKIDIIFSSYPFKYYKCPQCDANRCDIEKHLQSHNYNIHGKLFECSVCKVPMEKKLLKKHKCVPPDTQ